MAERVPIWYEFDGGRLSVGARPHLQRTAAQLHRELNLSIAIAYADDEGKEIRCLASSGPAAPIIGISLNPDEGICAACVRQNRLQLSHDTAVDPTVSTQLCQQFGIRSILAVPLRRGTKCRGLLGAFSDVADRFDPALIERIRNEAAKIEEHLRRGAFPHSNVVSNLAAPEATAGERVVPLFGTYARQRCASEDRWNRALALASPVKIAALSSCALLTVALLASVIHYKASADPRTARSAEASIQVSKTQVRNVASRSSADGSALRRLREQAGAGEVRAQTALAACYERGTGVSRDPLKAAVWYIIAGANGEPAAKQRAVRISHGLPQYEIAQIRFNVGKMYMDGSGVPRDLVAAYSWFALAQAAGDIRAQVEQQKLEAMMSQAQVSAALQRASDWLLAHRTHANHSSTVVASAALRSRRDFQQSK